MPSFIDVAADSHFPIQNLPYGVFSRPDVHGPRIGVAIGNMALDLALIEEMGLLDLPELKQTFPFKSATLNAFMGLGQPAWRAVRKRIQDLLSNEGDAAVREERKLREAALIPQ
ncbi:MAG: fumarylacetoacetase, partial [Bacteroidetes bacterium]|nr:fumarylacetoacetase [Bacteroidota bacterium]